MDTVDDVLAHYGVKGMKWGVRRSDKQLARAAASRTGPDAPDSAKKIMGKRVSKRASKKARELSEDAAEFKALKQKVKEKGVDSLSNEDLKKINQRMELQTKYNKAFPKKKNPIVALFVDSVMSDYGSTAVATAVTKKNPAAGAAIAAALTIGKQVKKK